MPCAIGYWFICSVFRFLLSHVWFCCCLIFSSAFVHYLPDFGAQSLTFACFAVCTFASVSLPRLAQLFLVIFCFLLCSGILTYIILAASTCFVVIVKFFSDFVARVRACLFCLKNRSVAWIYICSFCFVRAFFVIVSACAFDRFTCKPIAIINLPKLCPLHSLFGFLCSPKLA